MSDDKNAKRFENAVDLEHIGILRVTVDVPNQGELNQQIRELCHKFVRDASAVLIREKISLEGA